MQKFVNWLEKYLMPIAAKLSANRYLAAITSGFTAVLPPIMIGAIFSLLANLQIDIYQTAIAAVHLDEIFAMAPTVTTDMISLYIAFGIGYFLAKNIGIGDYSMSCGVISLLCFLLMIPLGVSGTTDAGETVEVSAALSTTYLGSAGMFSAIIIGLLVPTIFKVFIDKNITIKMPASVPPTISKSFSSLIPAFAISFIFSLVRFAFSFTTWGSLNAAIYTVIRTPLMSLGANPLTFCVLIWVCSLMWFFGIHGGMVVMSVLNILYLPMQLENLAALSAGEEMTNLITYSMWNTTASLGGAGGTIGLCIFLCFFAKSEKFKALGKIALPCGLCGINEPVTFGLPVVMNPVALIPLLVVPTVTFLLTYLCESIGLIPLFNGVSAPLGTPVILSGFLANGWQMAILQVVLVAIQFVIWFPFAKVLDNQAVKEEEEYAAQLEAEQAA